MTWVYQIIIITLAMMTGAAFAAWWYERRVRGDAAKMLVEGIESRALKNMQQDHKKARKRIDKVDQEAKKHELDISNDPDYIPELEA
jgi:hypothetical protein